MMSAASDAIRVIKGQSDKPVMSLCTIGDFIPHLFEGQLFEGMTFLKGVSISVSSDPHWGLLPEMDQKL